MTPAWALSKEFALLNIEHKFSRKSEIYHKNWTQISHIDCFFFLIILICDMQKEQFLKIYPLVDMLLLYPYVPKL